LTCAMSILLTIALVWLAATLFALGLCRCAVD
jgi:hypothetical protein